MNYFEDVDFERIVYTVDYEQDGYPIIEHKLRDIVWKYAEPGSGGGDCMFVEGVNLYCHEAGYGKWRELVYTFDTEAEAQHALLLCHLFDMDNSRGIDGAVWVYDKRIDAENERLDVLEEETYTDDE